MKILFPLCALTAILFSLTGCPTQRPLEIEPVPLPETPAVESPKYPADYQLDVIEQQEAEKALEEATPKDQYPPYDPEHIDYD